MNILAIESSCDETAAAVVTDGRHIRASVVASQVAEHALYGGVVPEIASRRHAEAVSALTRQALAEAEMTLSDIGAVAVTHAPGLIGALLVGVGFAKGLAYAANRPLVPVHHLRAHIAANYLAHPALEPPFLCLVASGGHTHLVYVEGYTRFTVLGRTRDDAAGECFDKAARAMGLPYPGGAHLDRAAEGGDPRAYTLPRPRVEDAPLDFSFSGLKTAVLNTLNNAAQRGETLPVADLAASLRYTVCGILCDAVMAAAAQVKPRAIALAGGVAANALLRTDLTARCNAAAIPLYLPPQPLCGDNAAMVAAQGFYELPVSHPTNWSLNAAAAMGI